MMQGKLGLKSRQLEHRWSAAEDARGWRTSLPVNCKFKWALDVLCDWIRVRETPRPVPVMTCRSRANNLSPQTTLTTSTSVNASRNVNYKMLVLPIDFHQWVIKVPLRVQVSAFSSRRNVVHLKTFDAGVMQPQLMNSQKVNCYSGDRDS